VRRSCSKPTSLIIDLYGETMMNRHKISTLMMGTALLYSLNIHGLLAQEKTIQIQADHAAFRYQGN
jgi:hypothetical protein